MVYTIKKLFARQIYDSCGKSTIEVELYTETGIFRSTVANERSFDVNEILKSIHEINSIVAPELKNQGFAVTKQKNIDECLQEFKNKGVNAIGLLCVSMTVCKAGAYFQNKALYDYIASLVRPELKYGILNIPAPIFKMIKYETEDGYFEEFSIGPKTKTLKEALNYGVTFYSEFEKEFPNAPKDMGGAIVLSSDVISKESYNERLRRTIEKCDKDGNVTTFNENGANINNINPEFIQLSLNFSEFSTIRELLRHIRPILLNPQKKLVVCNSIGETGETFIADLAVGLGAHQIKMGPPCKLESLVKYHHLLRIEELFLLCGLQERL